MVLGAFSTSNLFYLYSNSFRKHSCKVEQFYFLDMVYFRGQGHNKDIHHIVIQDLSNFEYEMTFPLHMNDCTSTSLTILTSGH